MNNILKWLGAVVAVAVVSFGAGYLLQRAAVSEARQQSEACATTLEEEQATVGRQGALLALYRARLELVRNNFGTAGDNLADAKERIEKSGPPEALVPIDEASAAVMGQDAAAVEAIQRAIRLLEPPGRRTPPEDEAK